MCSVQGVNLGGVVGKLFKGNKKASAATVDPAVQAEQDAAIAANLQTAATRRRRRLSSLLAGGASVLGSPSGGGSPAGGGSPVNSSVLGSGSGYSQAGGRAFAGPMF